MACAVEATFEELRMQKGLVRVTASDIHKCYEAMRIMHQGLDGTPTGVFEDFAETGDFFADFRVPTSAS